MRNLCLIYTNCLFLLGLVSCSLAPDYQRPMMDTPVQYKASGDWVSANPKAATLARGPWWEMYEDPELNDLQKQLMIANQDLKAAVARYDQAKAQAAIVGSKLYPTIDAIAVPIRQGNSQNVVNASAIPEIFNSFFVGADLSYEIDVWGQIRDSVKDAEGQAKATKADVQALQLSLQALLANYYFALRGTDLAQEVLNQTVVAYEKALYLNRMLYEGGAASVQTFYEAQTQLEAAKSLAIDMQLQREQLENAIAVLIGKMPAEFTLPVNTKTKQNLVVIKPELPSTLLERRPDIAAAELRVQAANANIGVARTAYFPLFNLVSSIGFASQNIDNLFSASSFAWAIGPASGAAGLGTVIAGAPITQIITNGGENAALNNKAWARYAEEVANYRQIALTAYQEVEDSLVALHKLGQEEKTQTAAAKAAYRAMDQAIYRYRGGLTTYLDVVVEQNIALQNELAAINIRTRHQNASVQLIKALGGGWRQPS